MTNSNPLATLAVNLSRAGAVAMGKAIERGPRYRDTALNTHPAATPSQFAYVSCCVDSADRAIELVA